MKLLVLVLAACSAPNPLYCEGHPDDTVRCPSHDASDRCTTDDECAGQICDDGACVECAPDRATCPATEPVCSDRACRGCVAHVECGSAACLPDGSCAAEGEVAYVEPGGTGGCTRAAPCGTIADGLATGRSLLKLAGAFDERVAITDRTITILAEDGARLSSTGNGVLLEIDGTSDVAIFDLEISGASGAGNPGISLPPGNAARLALDRATIAGNQGGGIVAAGGHVVVERSIIAGNPGGGIVMTASGVVELSNNFIHHNGNPVTAPAGGLALRPIGASRVELNTIVDNQANLGAASAGGVFCDVGGFVAANNIIFRNTGGATGSAQTFGNCTYGSSLVMAGASPVDNALGFANPNLEPFDYRLTAATPPAVRDAAGACTGVDFDGDPRPQGAACDLGADELRR